MSAGQKAWWTKEPNASPAVIAVVEGFTVFRRQELSGVSSTSR